MTPSGPFRGLCFGTVIRLGRDEREQGSNGGNDVQVGARHTATRFSWPGGKAGLRRMSTGWGAET